MSALRLPAVDLRAYASGDAAAKARVLETLLRSCEEWGFLLLDGHGLDARARYRLRPWGIASRERRR